MSDVAPDNRFSGLKVRALSALVLAPVMVAIVIAGGSCFITLMIVAALLSLYEWYAMSKAGPRPTLTFLFGFLYLLVSFSSYVFLRFGFEQGAWLALVVVLCVWASDIGGYFAGKFIGGPKMAPKLSPKKTWAGLAGAMLGSAALLEILLFYSQSLHAPYLDTNIGLVPEESWLCVFFVGLALGLVGQVGDVSVSYFKRRAHLKDTGHIIPGHGGLLDRIDALLLVTPVFALIYMAFAP
jgi:phosphatidate cytidylyltransferase